MKLLDWMQHRFRQTDNEPPTEFAPRHSCSCHTGQPSLDDLQCYPKSHFYEMAPSEAQREGEFCKSFTCIETARGNDEQVEEEESAAVFSELFHGFLAIETLATETVTNEPATPTFATYVEYNVGKENELKLIDDELENVLEPIGKENGAVVCPLQDYLFGSIIEFPETVTVKKEKEHRTTLGGLFQRTKMVEEVTEMLKEKETEKSAVYMMKKLIKGSTLCSSSRHSTVDKRPRKILQMFYRKVHHEELPVEPKSKYHLKHVTKGNFTKEHIGRNHMLLEDITLFPVVDTSNKDTSNMSDSNRNRECWITTDAEYLVLEL